MNPRFDIRDFLKRIAIMAVPVAFQNLLTTSGSMVDTMMIAPLGETTVGAIGLCAQFSSLLFSCYWGFVAGGMLFFAQYFGAKDDKGVNRSYGMTFACLLTLACVFSALALFAPQLVMRLYTDKVEIQRIGVQYLKLVGFAYPLQVIANGQSALLRTTDQVRIPLIASICSVVTNMFLNWVLIYGNLNMPAMGVQGAALATTIAGAVNVAVIMVMARMRKHPYLFQIRSQFQWTKAYFTEFLLKSLPMICNEFAMGFGHMVINIVLGRQTTEAIAAYAVFRTLEGLVIGFFWGFSNSASVLVGSEVGAGRLEIAYERGKRLPLICSACITLVCVVLLALHRPLLTAMGLSGESLKICFGMLCIYGAVASFIRMANWTMNDTYRSAGDARYGSILEITFMIFMVIPCVCVAGFVLKLPVLAIFAICYVDEIFRFVLMQRHLHSGKWIRPVTQAGRAALPEFFAKRKAIRTNRV